MRALVTGGAGFIGSHLVDKLIELRHEVTVVDNIRSGKKENINPKAKFSKLDIRDQELDSVFAEFNPEVIFHLAAQNEVPYSMEHPYEDCDMNIVGMMKLMDLSAKYGVKKVIYSNTGGAYYGDLPEDKLPIKEDEPVLKPTSFYGVSKAAAENYLKLYGNLKNIDWVSLRYANVYGPRQDGNKEAGVVAIFTSKLLNKEKPRINGDGSHTRDYVYVGDVVEANIKAMEYPKNDYFNISTGVRTSNIQVFETIEAELKTGIEVEHGPNRPGDALHVTLDNSKAKEKLGWKPKVDFKTGVNLTANYYLKARS